MADRSHGRHQKFTNDRSLTDEQCATVLKWIEAGAPQGDAKDMPAPKVWPEDQGWNFAAKFGQKNRPDHQVGSVHDACAVAGRVGQAHHRREIIR
ncbi:MAG: hypothetical protein U0Q11_22975 [Vicinamibacterales bacterium]